MHDLLTLLLIAVLLAATVLLPIFLAVLLGRPGSDDDEEEMIRPKLSSKELKGWTAIYQSMCIHYRGYIISESSIADETWDRWAELTGKEQWVKEEKSVGV